MNAIWDRIAARQRPALKAIFDIDPARLDRFTLNQGPIRFDWSKTHLTDELVDDFLALAGEPDFVGQRDALFAGEPVNNSEGRAAEHCAERGEGNVESVAHARMLHNRMRAMIDAIAA